MDGVAVVGSGRLGTALLTALPDSGGPFGRGFAGVGYDVVILAVPDREIANAAAAIAQGPIVGHCSGATGLDVLAPHRGFSLHPLMTFSRRTAAFEGAYAAVAGTTADTMSTARGLAERLGMTAIEVAEEDRAAYHASASIASNLLVTLEDAAEQLLATTGVGRAALVPLIRQTVDNWAVDGRAALTGPIARGDVATVDRQRDAIADRTPALLAMFDVLADRTRAVAGGDR